MRICRGDYLDLQQILVGEDRYIGQIRAHVPGLGELYSDLEQILPPGSGGRGERTSGSRDQALPFNAAVSDHRRDIQDILTSWVLQHVDDTTTSKPTSVQPADLCRWLEARLDHAARQDWIGDYAGELRQLRGRARALLDPERSSAFAVGWCVTPGCEVVDDATGATVPSQLVADIRYSDHMLPAVIYCAGPCAAEWPPHTWIQLGRMLGKEAA